jgi:hypothetical protein
MGRVAERSSAGWRLAQAVVDEAQHPVEIMVPESQYFEALASKLIVAIRIRLSVRVKVMLAAIDLDD